MCYEIIIWVKKMQMFYEKMARVSGANGVWENDVNEERNNEMSEWCKWGIRKSMNKTCVYEM